MSPLEPRRRSKPAAGRHAKSLGRGGFQKLLKCLREFIHLRMNRVQPLLYGGSDRVGVGHFIFSEHQHTLAARYASVKTCRLARLLANESELCTVGYQCVHNLLSLRCIFQPAKLNVVVDAAFIETETKDDPTLRVFFAVNAYRRQ